MDRCYNFSAGPTMLPTQVLEAAMEAIKNFKGSCGVSVLELYHRSEDFVAILEDVKKRLRALLALGEDYEVLLLSGGASLQFAMVPLNFLAPYEKAAFVDTGYWSSKAIPQAQKFGKTEIIASGKSSRYNVIPSGIALSGSLKEFKYLHICSNNTVYGTSFTHFPSLSVPLIVDVTSDLFSRELPIQTCAVAYASLQKNLGIPGAALVLINKNFLKEKQVCDRAIPDMLDYSKQIAAQSLYNTPSTFTIYVCHLMLKWLQDQGSLRFLYERNRQKAKILYEAIDASRHLKSTVSLNDRSISTITFSAQNAAKDAKFLAHAAAHRCIGLAGHREAGGLRAALFNAISIQQVEYLATVIEKFR